MELPRSSEEHADLHTAYLVSESQAVLHHVSEALFRLFLAHAAPSLSPWLEVAGLRSFAKFKKQVATLATHRWPEHLAAAVPWVFLGGNSPTSAERVAAATAPITRLMRYLAADLLQDSNLYNAVKHGMAIIASEDAYVAFATDAGELVMGTNGASVAFLESADKDNLRSWSVTRRWLSIRRAIWLAQLALVEIDVLWAIARARYCEAELDGVRVITADAVESGITGDLADRGGISRFSQIVAVEQLPALSAKPRAGT